METSVPFFMLDVSSKRTNLSWPFTADVNYITIAKQLAKSRKFPYLSDHWSRNGLLAIDIDPPISYSAPQSAPLLSSY